MKTPKRSVSSAENSSIDYAKQYAYIEDIEDVFISIYRTLKQNGVFLLNIEHPSFTAGVH